MGSEIARFREQQALAEQSAQAGLSGYATVSRHDFIEKKMEQRAMYIEHLMDTGRQDEAFALLETDNWQGIPAVPTISPQALPPEQEGRTG